MSNHAEKFKCKLCLVRYRIGPLPVAKSTERLICPDCKLHYWCRGGNANYGEKHNSTVVGVTIENLRQHRPARDAA